MESRLIRILHAGCGGQPLPEWLPGEETRLDIDPGVSPDIVAPLTALGDIGPFDIVYCSHTLEHLPPHEIRIALREFHRVLRPQGFIVLVVPNLKDIKPDNTVYYQSAAGPVTGLDMYYGMDRLVEHNPWMAHKYGFVPETLQAFVENAGFTVKATDTSSYNLYVTAQA